MREKEKEERSEEREETVEETEKREERKSRSHSATWMSHLELAIGRTGLGWAGPIVGWAKIRPGQNRPGFFGPKC